ncbi:MAG: HAD family hydrolase [Nitrospira sp.]|nr:HAD family hydrolase [Nitrospira sp.]
MKSAMPMRSRSRKRNVNPVVFLLDVDNTLLDNDRVTADLRRHLEHEIGGACQQQYWAIFEQLRAELGYADYLGALQRYRIEHPHDHNLLAISSYLVNYPFADRLYPDALDVVEQCQKWGTPVILSDGDVVFQPRKIERSGLYEAVRHNVLIYVHKERELSEVERRYPADHYVLVDDKLRILTAVKQAWGRRVTTVFPRQGHYATDSKILAAFPAADITLDRIGDLLKYDLYALVSAGRNHQGNTMPKKAQRDEDRLAEPLLVKRPGRVMRLRH